MLVLKNCGSSVILRCDTDRRPPMCHRNTDPFDPQINMFVISLDPRFALQTRHDAISTISRQIGIDYVPFRTKRLRKRRGEWHVTPSEHQFQHDVVESPPHVFHYTVEPYSSLVGILSSSVGRRTCVPSISQSDHPFHSRLKLGQLPQPSACRTHSPFLCLLMRGCDDQL